MPRSLGEVSQCLVYEMPSSGRDDPKWLELTNPERQISGLLEGVRACALLGSVSDLPVVAVNYIRYNDRGNQSGVGLKAVLGRDDLDDSDEPALGQLIQMS